MRNNFVPLYENELQHLTGSLALKTGDYFSQESEPIATFLQRFLPPILNPGYCGKLKNGIFAPYFPGI
jgi:hypothetical protein